MNPELLAAYHYLSSAIAQAFAALIALTAMFYIYRITKLENEKKKIAEGIRATLALAQVDKLESFTARLETLKRINDDELMKKVSGGIIFKKDDSIPKSLLLDCTEYLNTQWLVFVNKKRIILPITLSSVTMILGFFSLLFGPLFTIEGIKWAVMGLETLLACIALFATVITIKKMLKDYNITLETRKQLEKLKAYQQQQESEKKKPAEPQAEAEA